MGDMKGASGSVEYVPIHIRVCYDHQGGGLYHNRKVKQMKDGKVVKAFASIAEASADTSISYQAIYRCLTDGQKTAGGFTWTN